MKYGLAAAAVCAAITVAVWMGLPEPAGDQVWAYQKLRPADYRLLYSDALGFVTVKADEGFELHVRHAGETSFEIRCKGVLVMHVENAPSRVLIRMPADARWRSPDIEQLRISFERWLLVQQIEGRLLVERAGPSWVEARFGRLGGAVTDDQRCVFRDPGRPWPESPSSFRLSSRPLQAVEGMAASSSALFRLPQRIAKLPGSSLSR
ncbi:cold-shock protein [Stenotrophomonas maltophilia]|uniref:cold-shock protein n=1 Tax=Stenotrophomonas maltophilia TaxID=40324 RepID=UPI00240D3A80|nr:cold-shock protein [Stenotrophomonas maltophilia]MDG2510972.1 cold-shock protein [Stenotrophomonas maltophilia]